MRMVSYSIPWSLVMLLAFTACGPSTGPSQPGAPGGGPASAGPPKAPQKDLVVVLRGEPPSLAAKPIIDFSGSLSRPRELFNAMLDFRDERERPQAQLAEALPQLNSATWRVFPDGRMETRYTLKPNLTWHDGTALSAEDFVFAWRVYATPDFGAATTPPIGPMEEVVAPDARTVIIHWKQPFPEAVSLDRDFQPLPRHILEEPFRTLDPITFSNQPFWTFQYVDLGPYRVSGWEPGAFIIASAFDNYVLGRPKIDQIRMLFIADPQTAMANILAGEAHLIADPIFGVTEGVTIERQLAQSQGGTVLYSPVGPRTGVFQMRPEYVDSPALLDPRVRRAVAAGLDTPTAIEVLTEGKAIESFTITHPRVEYYAEIERAIIKHTYDPRRAQQITDEVGFRKGPDGFFIGPDGQTIKLSMSSSAGERQEQEVTIYVDSLRRVGLDAAQRAVSVQEIRDPRIRAIMPGLQMRGGGDHPSAYTTQKIPGTENRWHGSNRGGWSNPENDRLVGLYMTSLEPTERVKLLAQIERLITEEVPLLVRQFNAYVVPHVAALRGPVARHTPYTEDTFLHVHIWEWQA
jgi:peptide/nickel transport system substrate-binding protein